MENGLIERRETRRPSPYLLVPFDSCLLDDNKLPDESVQSYSIIATTVGRDPWWDKAGPMNRDPGRSARKSRR